MSDDPNVLALFYGPDLPPFETFFELILRGSKDEILKNLPVADNSTIHL
jgi:hypothetical protein